MFFLVLALVLVVVVGVVGGFVIVVVACFGHLNHENYHSMGAHA